MKINERVANYMALLNGDLSKNPTKPRESAGQPDTASSLFKVDISSKAIQLADDEARRGRLDSIRQQLAEGSYNISGKDVADKILNVLKG